MSASTVILIIVAAIAEVLILTALALAWRNKRTANRRAEAGHIRTKAAEQADAVGQREPFTDEIAARSRASQAEAEAMAAHAAGLEHQAQQHRGDAATARGEVNQAYARADKVDPEVTTGHSAHEATETRGAERPAASDASTPTASAPA